MKTNHITRIVFCLLTSSFFLAKSGQAQTLTLPDKATSSLEAGMYSIAGLTPAIKIHFDNTSGGSVRLMILDQDGTVFYDEQETMVYYRRRFDLSELPAGHYRVELSKGGKRFTQTFVIEQPIAKRIAMEGMMSQTTIKNDKKVAINQ